MAIRCGVMTRIAKALTPAEAAALSAYAARLPGGPGYSGSPAACPPARRASIPEMVLERGADVQRDQQRQPDHADAVRILGEVEHPALPRGRQVVEGHRRNGHDARERQRRGGLERRPHRPAAERQQREQAVEQDMRDVRRGRLPAEPVGIVDRPGDDQPPHRAQHARAAAGSGRSRCATDRPRSLSPPTRIALQHPARPQLIQHQRRHHPVEGDPDRRIAALAAVALRPAPDAGGSCRRARLERAIEDRHRRQQIDAGCPAPT